MRQVKSVFALNIPGRNVVGEGVADDLALFAENHGEFRFRGSELRIGTDADVLVRAYANARGALEEDFGALLAVDIGIHAFAGGVVESYGFTIAERG